MSIDIGMMTTADSTPTPTRQWPQRPTNWLIGGLFAALVIALLGTLAVLNRPTNPAVVAAAPVATHAVVINAVGTIVVYDAYGPRRSARGSVSTHLSAVPDGTLILVIAISTKASAASMCNILIDGAKVASMDGVGEGAVSECSTTVS